MQKIACFPKGKHAILFYVMEYGKENEDKGGLRRLRQAPKTIVDLFFGLTFHQIKR